MEKLYIKYLQVRGLSAYTVKDYTERLVRFMKKTGLNTQDFAEHRKIRESFLGIADYKANNLMKYKIAIERYSDFLEEFHGYEKIRLHKIKVGKTIPCSLTREQVNELFLAMRCMSPKIQLMVEVMVYTGMRRKEVANLRQEDIKADGIHIRSGKGNKDRFIYCPARLINRMKTLGPNVFDIKGQGIMSAFQRLAKKVPFRVYPHLLRHTYATSAIRSDIDIFTISGQLGHSDIKTTHMYFHMNNKQTKAQMKKLRII